MAHISKKISVKSYKKPIFATDMAFINSFIPTLPFMVCLFWTLHAGLSYKNLNRAQRNLGIFLGVSMLLFLYHAIYFSDGEASAFNLLAVIYSWATLTVYPLYYLYVESITDSRKPGPTEKLLLFIPGIIAAAGGGAVLAFGLNRGVLDVFIAVTRPIQTILVCILCLVKLTAFDRSVYDSYSEVEGKTARPVKILAAVQMAAALCTVVLSLLGQKFFFGKTILAVPSLLFAGTIYAIAYVGFRYRFGAEQMEEDLTEDIPVENARDDSGLYDAILDKMENGRLFLQPGLSVVDLARAIGSNRTYVSACINSNSGKSFAMFINSYRVEYAKKLMKENSSLSIAQVGEMSGFASEESFRRNFRSFTGKSPSGWMG